MHVAESKDEIRLLQGKKSGFEKLYAKAGWDSEWAPKDEFTVHVSRRTWACSALIFWPFMQFRQRMMTSGSQRNSVPVAHCPRSNKETGVGRMPLKKFLDAGITVGLGTDSLASSPS